MATTYEKIATTTLGTAASSITFSSIAATYTDLRLVLVCKASTNMDAYVQYNSDTGSNYSLTELNGSGSAASSTSTISATYILLDSNGVISAAQPQLFNFDIFSYAGSTFKTCLINMNRDYNGSGNVTNTVGLWRSTIAINAITITGTSNFAIGSSATIYGILKA
jgi:hypothetical protein